MQPRTTLQDEVRDLPVSPLSPLLNREAVRDANRWLARFAPLLGELEQLTAAQCRTRLGTVPALRDEGAQVLLRLREQAAEADRALLATVQDAVRELDGLESDLRRRLAILAPDDPQAAVDLSELREKLAEVAARREVEQVAGSLTQRPMTLELRTSPPNWGGALFMGIFSFGWLSFTTVHAVFMIGGMYHAFGPLALAMLAFYAIFWAVGLAMGWGAVMSASQEHLAVEGRRLTLTRKFLVWTWSKQHAVNRDSRAYVKLAQRNNGVPSYQIAVTDAEGREIGFASGRPEHELERLAERLNEYLSTFRD
ncbi:MAG: hypothetical protein K0Q72_719 [Armatimonadetes bacterium]|jgi:hypothetical protein|nr:hypothetical protein [Armatimonadota bacterium]